jgi:hypothetical protein
MTCYYEFQSALFRNSSAVASAIVNAWMTSGGAASAREVAESLAYFGDPLLADDCINSWGLLEIVNNDESKFENAESETWLEIRGLTRDELVQAFTDFRSQFDPSEYNK